MKALSKKSIAIMSMMFIAVLMGTASAGFLTVYNQFTGRADYYYLYNENDSLESGYVKLPSILNCNGASSLATNSTGGIFCDADDTSPGGNVKQGLGPWLGNNSIYIFYNDTYGNITHDTRYINTGENDSITLTADNITAGTFPSGNFFFQGNLNVKGTINASRLVGANLKNDTFPYSGCSGTDKVIAIDITGRDDRDWETSLL